MVKQVLSFIRWQFLRIKWHDYLWTAAVLMTVVGWNENGVLVIVGLSTMIAMMFGFLFKVQWQRWKSERKDLFNSIKNSK